MKRKKIKIQTIKALLKPLFFNQLIIFLIIFFLPTQLGRHFFFPQSFVFGIRVDYLAPTIFFFDLLVALFFLFNYKSIFEILETKRFLFFIFLLFLNNLFSIFKIITFYRSLRLIEWYLLFSLFKKIKYFRTIKYGFFLGGIFQLFLAIFQLIKGGSLDGVFWFFGERHFSLSYPGIAKTIFFGKEILRPYATFSHPNSLAGFYLLLYFSFLTIKKLKGDAVADYLTLFVFSALILLSFSKIAILLWLIGNVFIFAGKINCRLCFFSKILTMMVSAYIFLSAKSDVFSFNNRLDLLKEAFLIFKNHWLTGVGLGAYVKAKELVNFTNLRYYLITQPVHYSFLLFLIEAGVFFSLFFFGLIFNHLKKLYSKNSIIFFSFLLTGFFDHYWWTLPQNFFLLAVIFALILS